MFANLDRLAQRMDELGLDGVVATTIENVYYLTGISAVGLEIFPHSGQCYALVTRDRLAHPHFVSTRCDVDQILDAVPTLDGAMGFGTFFREWPDGVELTEREKLLYQVSIEGPQPATPVEALVETLHRAGLANGRVAIDEEGVPHGYFERFRELMPTADVRFGADVLRWTRKVKTAEEADRIAAAAGVAELGIKAVIGIARPGVTEKDMQREFERTVAEAGARPKFTLIKIGRSGVSGQARPRDIPLKRGDSIWFDVGCVFEGYWSDIARVYSFGEPSDKLRRYYAAMLAGEERALAETRPGMTGRELYDLTVEAVREAGVPHYRRNHVGHGIGVEIYDPVLITPTNDDVIEEGTVVNIETPYYEFGLGAVHVEDPYFVGATGNRLLTTLDRGLGIID